jgi:hypothetical protein
VQGEAVLLEAVAAYRAALGDRLLAAYALGSLAHGGFSELVSDIDVGLILSDPPQARDPEAIQQVAESERRKGSPLHERLSVFWGTPATLAGDQEGGRFPPLDRLDLLENGRLLAGNDDARPSSGDRAQMSSSSPAPSSRSITSPPSGRRRATKAAGSGRSAPMAARPSRRSAHPSCWPPRASVR